MSCNNPKSWKKSTSERLHSNLTMHKNVLQKMALGQNLTLEMLPVTLFDI